MALSYLAVAVISVLAGLVVVFALNFVVPALYAPVVLFRLYSEVIAIDAYGAVFPVILSTSLFVVFRRSKVPDGFRPFRGYRFWASVGLVRLSFVLVTSYLSSSLGTTVLTTFEAELLVPLGGSFGALYAHLRKHPASVVGLEAYAIGTFGGFLSDLVLTLSGAVRAPGGELVWGGAGTLDLTLWFGLYLALPAYLFAKASPKFVSLFRRSGGG